MIKSKLTIKIKSGEREFALLPNLDPNPNLVFSSAGSAK
jgi:hypothetical protein